MVTNKLDIMSVDAPQLYSFLLLTVQIRSADYTESENIQGMLSIECGKNPKKEILHPVATGPRQSNRKGIQPEHIER